MPQNSKWLQKICFYGERLKFSDVFLYLFFALLHFQLILLRTGYSSQWSNSSIQGLRCCSQERGKKNEYLEAFIFPSVHRLYLVSVSHIVSHWVHGMSDKHIILIASWCYFLMLPSAQVTAGGQWGDLGEKVTLNFMHLCRQVSIRTRTRDGASWVSSTLSGGDTSKAKANCVWVFSTIISANNNKKENNTKQKLTLWRYNKGNSLC